MILLRINFPLRVALSRARAYTVGTSSLRPEKHPPSTARCSSLLSSPVSRAMVVVVVAPGVRGSSIVCLLFSSSASLANLVPLSATGAHLRRGGTGGGLGATWDPSPDGLNGYAGCPDRYIAVYAQPRSRRGTTWSTRRNYCWYR